MRGLSEGAGRIFGSVRRVPRDIPLELMTRETNANLIGKTL